MRKTLIYTAVMILFGIAAGFLRANELFYVFDSATGLPQPWHPFSLALIGLSALAALFALLFARGSLPSDYAPQPRPSVMIRALCVAVANSFMLAVSAVLGFWGLTKEFSITQLILAPLAVISAVTLALAMRQLCLDRAGSLGGLYATLPIFWGCFWLMLFFKDHAADPVLLNYTYELFSVIALILSLYLSAGSFFDERGRRRLLFFCMLGMYLNLLCLLAPVFQWFIFAGYPFMPPSLADLARHLFAVSHLGLLYWLTRHHKTMFT